MQHGAILPGSSGNDIHLFRDNKLVGIARHAVSCDQWCGVQLISGELYDQLAASDAAKILTVRHIYPRFYPYTGAYYGCGMTDTPEIDKMFENVMAVNSFELKFGMVPDSFKGVEGYRSGFSPEDQQDN